MNALINVLHIIQNNLPTPYNPTTEHLINHTEHPNNTLEIIMNTLPTSSHPNNTLKTIPETIATTLQTSNTLHLEHLINHVLCHNKCHIPFRTT